jgi:hypothetical protein
MSSQMEASLPYSTRIIAQLVFCAVALTGTVVVATEKVDVRLLIDVSGSMQANDPGNPADPGCTAGCRAYAVGRYGEHLDFQ